LSLRLRHAALAAAALLAAGPALAEPGVPARAVAQYLRARLALQAGDAAAAARALEDALVHDEGSAALHLSLAEALLAAGQPARCEAEVRRALELDRAGPVAVRARMFSGRTAAAAGRWERAGRELREAVAAEAALAVRERRRPDPEPSRTLALVLAAAGDDAGATRALEALAAALPSSAADGHVELSHLARDARDLPRAERHLRRAVELSPRDPRAWRALARLAEQRDAPAEAHAAWEAAVRADPEDEDALLALARDALRERDLAAARGWLRQLVAAAVDGGGARVTAAFAWIDAGEPAEALAFVEGHGPDPRLDFVRGVALSDLRRFDEAAAAFAEVPSDGGDLDALARAREGFCLSRAGRHADALAVLARARAAHPRDVRLVTTQGHALARAGRAAEAVSLLEGSLEEAAEGDGAALSEGLAAILVETGRAGDAVLVLERAVAAHPGDPGLLYSLGAAHERAGDLDAGLARMRALLAIEPDHPDALNFVAYTWADRGVRLDEAEAMLRRALELRPGEPSFLDSLGWVYFRKGDLARAVEALERAASADPDATILEHLGDAYRAAGRAVDAERAWRRALEALAADPPPGEGLRREERRAAIEKKMQELLSMR
jgi:tetratricopeptide (TPR) repeat protein